MSGMDIPETNPANPQRRLAILDPSPLRQEYLRAGLAGEAPLWRIDVAASVADLVTSIAEGHDFRVILLSSPTASAIDPQDILLLSEAVSQTPILVTTDCEDPEWVRMILSAGAKGFFPASLGLKALVAALERVSVGDSYVPLMPLEAKREPTSRASPELEWQKALTRQQRAVLAHVSEGQSNKAIADALSLSESTIKAHVKQIIRRLHVSNRTQAALFVTQSRARMGLAARSEFTEAMPPFRESPNRQSANWAPRREGCFPPEHYRTQAMRARSMAGMVQQSDMRQVLLEIAQDLDQIADAVAVRVSALPQQRNRL